MNDYQLISTVCAIYLTGLIWTIQLVHYPSFNYISNDKQIKFHHFHQKMMGILAGPAMLIELISTTLYCLEFKATKGLDWTMIASMILVTITFFSTFFIQVPIHQKLIENNLTNKALIKKLVQTNWIRTLSWTLKAIIQITYYL